MTIVGSSTRTAQYQRSYHVIGSETKEADLSTLGQVKYRGTSSFDMAPDSGYVSYRDSSYFYDGQLALDADFTKGVIGGTITDLEVTRIDSSGAGVKKTAGGNLTLSNSRFSQNGYEGALSGTIETANGVDGVTLTDSRYAGAFFGPKAENTAGVLSVKATTATGAAANGVGAFKANKAP